MRLRSWILTTVLVSMTAGTHAAAAETDQPNVVYILSDDVGWGDLSVHGGGVANAHGFDEAWVYYGGGADYFNRRTVKGTGPVSWWHNREFRPQDEGYTDDLVTRAGAFKASKLFEDLKIRTVNVSEVGN